MQQSIKRVRRLFTITIVGLCVASMMSLLAVLYVTSSSSFDENTSPQELQTLTSGYPAVTEYLQEQKQNEAHFITIANLIKSDQENLLARTALLVTLPLLAASAVLGYLLARYLLRPVEEAYASQERFVQDAAHELRNPLATMSAVLQQAKQPKNLENDDSAPLEVLERQTNHLVRINEDLLFLERRQKTNAKPVDVAELLQDVAETLQLVATQKNVRLTVQADPTMLAINPDDFVCLARNLIENAIKYSPESKKSRVIARLEQNSRSVTLLVKDNGIGIPESELQHIGERFYRASNVARRSGSGLGFAIVRKIASDYQAHIHIASQLGKGTTVSVQFKR